MEACVAGTTSMAMLPVRACLSHVSVNQQKTPAVSYTDEEFPAQISS